MSDEIARTYPVSFYFDQILTGTKMVSFWNYDMHKRFFSEIEVFLKMFLYQNSELLLKKMSSNRPEYFKLMNVDNVKHDNFTNFLEIADSGLEKKLDPKFNEHSLLNRLFSQSMPMDGRV
jgi:hypothetical protein